jgi:hypothetical protein
MRCGIVFQALRNHHNRLRSVAADGLLINCYGQQVDFVDGKVKAYLLSTNKVLIKQPLMPNTAVVTRYSGLFPQSYQSSMSYMLEERHEHRRSHYILLKFPSSYQLENLYSRTTTSCKIDAVFTWYGALEQPQFPAVSCVQWPLALTNTRQRVKLSDTFGAETPEARAAREAWECTNAAPASSGGTSFTVD